MTLTDSKKPDGFFSSSRPDSLSDFEVSRVLKPEK